MCVNLTSAHFKCAHSKNGGMCVSIREMIFEMIAFRFRVCIFISMRIISNRSTFDATIFKLNDALSVGYVLEAKMFDRRKLVFSQYVDGQVWT